MIRLVRDWFFAAFAVIAVSNGCTCDPVGDDDDGGEGEGEEGEGEEGEGEEGEGEGEGGDYTPPDGAYFLVSPVAAAQADESDELVADAEFTAQIRVGNVEDLTAFGFVIRWDPALVEQVSRERIDTWLTSAEGQILPLTDNLDAEAGELTVGFAIADGPVSTTSSEAIYEITFDFVGAAAAATITADLSADGLVQEDGTAALEDVTVVSLDVRQ